MSPVLLLLPGMDGTGKLLAGFTREPPPHLAPRVVSYPPDQVLNYEALERIVERSLPVDAPFAIVAESFSGPLALRVASRSPAGLVAVVLVASFVRAPRRLFSAARCLIRPGLFRLAPPPFMVRRVLLGADASDASVREFQEVLGTVSPAVLASRLREIARVDVTEELRRCPARLLYVAGRRDRLVPGRVGRDLQRLRPDLALETVDAPHLVLQRAGPSVARLIEDFLGASP